MRTIRGAQCDRPPIWLMRQAGRYLPEYRATRAEAGSFLDLCFSPKLATEVTLQPIRRFGFDAAILFSDILIIPWALGQDVRFEQGVGPVLEPIASEAELAALDLNGIEDRLESVGEAIELINAGLGADIPLIGFIGAPWTLMTYMIGGRSTPDQGPAKKLLLEQPDLFFAMLEIVEEACARVLRMQIKAGVDVVKIFDSWAGSVPMSLRQKIVFDPIKRIIENVRTDAPQIPVIAFPRGIGASYLKFANEVPADVLALDQGMDPSLFDHANRKVALQGNMDPMFLLGSEAALADELVRQRDLFAGRSHIVNLGHGITPEGKIERVEQMIAFWRNAA
ncbi:MAG: uroporphyrinogen decarboxylase [Neomegalonema sp.]|nr:uroporphyrinogen decarboxylase [Neomegalonema sp.]